MTWSRPFQQFEQYVAANTEIWAAVRQAGANFLRLQIPCELWLFGTSAVRGVCLLCGIDKGTTEPKRPVGKRRYSMKKVALALALVVTALSLGGCFVGKGKAPAPVITKG